MSTTEYRKITCQGATFIVGTDGSVDGLRHYSLNGRGYMKLNRIVDGKPKTFLVHRIVAAAWLEPPLFEEQTQIDHIDGDKQNNRVENLRWVTPKENCKTRTRLRCRRVVAVNVKTGISYVAASPREMRRILGIGHDTIEKYARLDRPYKNWLFVMNKALKGEDT